MTKSICFEGFAHLCFFPSQSLINCESGDKPSSSSTSCSASVLSTEKTQALKNNPAENSTCHVKCSQTQNLSSNSHENTLSSPLYFKGHMIFEKMSMHFALRGIPSTTAPPDVYDLHGCQLDKPIYYDVTVQEHDAKQKWEFKWVRWWGGDAGWMSSDPRCLVTGERFVPEQESTSEEQFIWFSTTLIKGNEEAQRHVKKYLNIKSEEEEIDVSHVCIGEMKLIVETDNVEDEFESFEDDENGSVCNYEIMEPDDN
ncbi:10908_t:CDS:1 [Scutellospora calospora]|uniref:10908_t:CDS:1 n=1 Tax=Scutellospora calospora TaxID=85575 RepID=A0ACA9LHX4_9GLOM|nr:10908_t:CDS:1 [Scutellospora calospora]